MVDLREGPGPPLFLDQNEPRKAQKIFSGDPPPSSKGLDDHLPPESGTAPYALPGVPGLQASAQ